MKAQLPTKMPLGKMFTGPDYPGCINSGHAPLICKSKIALQWLGKSFVVCDDFAWRFMKHETICELMSGEAGENVKRYHVKLYKTYAPAKADFMKRCETVEKEYAGVAEQKTILRTGTQTEKMKAMFRLADHGMI